MTDLKEYSNMYEIITTRKFMEYKNAGIILMGDLHKLNTACFWKKHRKAVIILIDNTESERQWKILVQLTKIEYHYCPLY